VNRTVSVEGRAPRRLRDTWVFAAAIALLLITRDVVRTYPPLPRELTFYLTLPIGNPQHPDPIVATGWVGKGDFLLVSYGSAQTATFFYQSWGNPGISSPTVTFRPGVRIKVQLEMPALVHAGRSTQAKTAPLRLRLDGMDVFHQEVPFNACEPSRIFFAENPVGGPTVGLTSRSLIATGDGRRIQGNPDALCTVGAKLAHWLRTSWWHLLPILLTSAGITWVARRISQPRQATTFLTHGWTAPAARTHGMLLLFAAVNVTVFTWLMTGGKFRLVYPDAFGAFYDYQAESLLHGRLDVPLESLESEVFTVNRKHYGYFGPTPALLRLPFAVCGLGFGHLTRSFMAAHYLACLLAAYAMLRHIVRQQRGDEATPSPWAGALLMVSTGLGSTLLFLASRAYVYHEAILCGVAFALWGSYFALRYLDHTRARWWVGSLVCGILALQARPPAGLFALGFLGVVALAHLVAARRQRITRYQPVIVGAAAMAGVSTLFIVAYLKFGTIHGNPVKYNPQYTAERLAKIEGKSFHVANVRHNVDVYFLRPGIEMGARLPFCIFDVKKREYPGAKIDLDEHTAGMPYTMAGLFAMFATAGIGAVQVKQSRHPIVLLVLATLPLVVVMLTFIATSQRYTADFCPPLIIGAGFGLAFIDGLAGAKRVALLSTLGVLTAFAFIITQGLAFHYQVSLVWGVPEELSNNFIHLREIVDRWFPGQ
jgi:hypothetical protein